MVDCPAGHLMNKICGDEKVLLIKYYQVNIVSS